MTASCCGDGKKHPVTIIIQDSQSDTSRAAQVDRRPHQQRQGRHRRPRLRPPTRCRPVADQAEALRHSLHHQRLPVAAVHRQPWQPASSTQVFKWTYHTFWGLEDVQANFLDMWGQVPNQQEGRGACSRTTPTATPGSRAGNRSGARPASRPPSPASSSSGTEDFTSQISQFKKDGCEIGMGVFIPPDFTNFWKQATQQGWKPKFGTYAKALLFPQSVEAIGRHRRRSDHRGVVDSGPSVQVRLPERRDLPAVRRRVHASAATASGPSRCCTSSSSRWPSTPCKRATSVDDKEAILAAIKGTKLETIGGLIDFTAPVVGATPPFQVGPCHIIENVYKTPLVGGQWRKGTKYPFELTIVSNAAAKDSASLCRTRCKALRRVSRV